MDKTDLPLWLSDQNPALFLKRSEDALAVAFQPIVDINTGETLSFESLVRGYQDIGFASVDELLDHAHATDHLLELDSILVRRSMQAHRKLREDAWSLLFLNVDGRMMGEWPRVRDMLVRQLASLDMEPVDVCIELSERNQVLETDAFAAAVEGLRAAGFAIAIDDFGMGDSGLQMLYQSNPDFIKIDRFFIKSMPHDPKKRLMVSSIVDLAHTLGSKVIAEGIETEAELVSCREARCDLAQGYLIARPTIDHAQLCSKYPVAREGKGPSVSRETNAGVKGLVEDIAVLSETDSLAYLVELLGRHQNQTVFPVIDRNGIPRGAVFENDIKVLMYSQYGHALAQNTNLGMTVLDFVRPIATVDIETPIGPRLELISEKAGHGVLVTRGLRYVGFLSSTSLVKLANDLRIRVASNQNPLSGLPGNQAILEHMDAQRGNTGEPRLACYVDIDNFKPFNDRYGFEAGDRAILMLASLLEQLARDHGVFAGHVGGDDFFVGCSGSACGLAERVLSDLAQRFAHAAESLYSPEDRAAGFIKGKARTGEEKTFPLLTCTVVGVRLDIGERVDDTKELTGQLAALKSQARALEKSYLVRPLASAEQLMVS